MCKCVGMVNKALAKDNTCLDQTSLLNLKTGRVRESIVIATRKIDRKVRRGPRALLPAFCPFCGEPIKKTKAA